MHRASQLRCRADCEDQREARPHIVAASGPRGGSQLRSQQTGFHHRAGQQRASIEIVRSMLRAPGDLSWSLKRACAALSLRLHSRADCSRGRPQKLVVVLVSVPVHDSVQAQIVRNRKRTRRTEGWEGGWSGYHQVDHLRQKNRSQRCSVRHHDDHGILRREEHFFQIVDFKYVVPCTPYSIVLCFTFSGNLIKKLGLFTGR